MIKTRQQIDLICADGSAPERGQTVVPDHYRSTFYIHNHHKDTISRIQEKFKVLWSKGDQICIQHTFDDYRFMQDMVRRQCGRLVTHIKTICVVRSN